ncbi:FAD-dependent oxidoreductase [Brevibacterium luteolum]|uniref:FAD-dependent oxidoreductase n=2 Tax=Brevibacterium luteolum TaxID=199591 RepID=A0A849AV01_9MICO|nr:FAD-dependent oxidoreductase [Brevibacterium luteolum]NNG78494.1 FAD-dependent oxidoreductase [Brevibacterium luteolum]
MAPIVVVGASLGGLRAVERLRAGGWDQRIIVIGAEPHMPYNRPPLSKDLLTAEPSDREVLDEKLAFRLKKSVHDVEWILGTRVVSADLDGQSITLSDGEEISYSGLVIATGLRPRRLEMAEGAVGLHVIRTREDSMGLYEDLHREPRPHVTVIGAGFIGCEAAASATQLGCSVTVIEGSTGPFERVVGPRLAAAFRNVLESRGVTFIGGERVTALECEERAGSQRVAAAVLSSGRTVPTDVIIQAIGSAPNVEWLQGNGLDLSDGVHCDESLRVRGVRNVVAVGDIARFPDPKYDIPDRRVEHWSTPTDTAKVAARSLLADLAVCDESAPAHVPPSFWSDLFEIRIQGYGLIRADLDTEFLEGQIDAVADGSAVAYQRDGRTVGVLTVGLPPQRQLFYRRQLEDADALLLTTK